MSKKICVAVLLAAFPLLLGAQDQVTVSLGDEVTADWNHPDEYENGDNLPLSEILNTAIFSARRQSNVGSGNMQIVDAPANSVVLDQLKRGHLVHRGAYVQF